MPSVYREISCAKQMPINTKILDYGCRFINAQPMEQYIYFGAIGLYSALLAAECSQRALGKNLLPRTLVGIEIFAFLLLTTIVTELELHNKGSQLAEHNYSLACFELSWSMSGIRILFWLLYRWQFARISTAIVTLVALFLLPNPLENFQFSLLQSELDWPQFPKFIFIISFAFFFLGTPITLRFFWQNVVQAMFKGRPKGAVLEHQFRELDRMHTKLILWALPLLSLGLCIRVLSWIDSNHEVSTLAMFHSLQNEFLALATWFTCAIFLHARIFLRWSYPPCAYLYLAALAALAGAHWSDHIILRLY